LFPPTLEDLLPEGHPARMVREFVDALDLEQMGFRVRKSEDGRPNYSANLCLKLWLYGYMTRVRTTRPLERASKNDIGMLWLTGMNAPDHTTLWRFWRDNRKAIRKLLKQLLEMAVSLDMVGLVLHAVDGTKIFSQASEQEGLHRQTLEKKLKRLDEAINEMMKETQQAAKHGSEWQMPEPLRKRQQLKEKIQEQLKQLKDRDHLQPNDEEARVMKCRSGKKFAYNAQVVVDQKSKLIVAADVVTDESDNYQLVPMLQQVEQNLGQVAENTDADAGYKAVTQLAAAEQKGYSVLVNLADPQDAPYHASRFIYDVETDQCICPRGERLPFQTTKPRDKVQPYEVRVYHCQNYEQCPVRWQCSSSKAGRTVQIHPDHGALVRQRAKLQDEQMRAILKQRGAIVEPVFGWSKEGMGFRRWTVRGLEKVQTQWLVLCTAMNLIRLHPVWAAGKFRFA
jgi:transposase